MSNTIDPDALLPRKRVAEELTAMGLTTAPSSLATQACRGGGPPYRTFGRAVVYRWGDVLAWAEARMTGPRRSTSELDRQEASQPIAEAVVAPRDTRSRARPSLPRRQIAEVDAGEATAAGPAQSDARSA
jgi:hypothetical protein